MEEQISVKELDSLCEQIFETRVEADKQEEVLSALNTKLQSLKQKVVGILEHLERESYSSPLGLVYRSEKWSIPTPKSWEEKEALIGFLEEKGGKDLARSYITFNNRSLLSFVKSEIEARESDGDLNTDIPGIGKISKYVDLGVRKK